MYERSQESYQTETLKLRSDRDDALKETATLQSKLEESQVVVQSKLEESQVRVTESVEELNQKVQGHSSRRNRQNHQNKT